MSNWSPYAPDFNPPPGIPKGFPYALNPSAPSTNPMYPNMPLNPLANNTPPFGANPLPNTSFPSPAGNSPYPSSSSPYSPTGSPYTPSSGPYPYPSSDSSPYSPAGSSPYPAAGFSPYSSGTSSPYPSSNSSTYPPGAVPPYPSAGSSPYPESGQPPYPGSGQPPYPGSGPPHNQANLNRGYPAGNIYRNMAEYHLGEGTVKPYPSFDPKVDAEVLRKAMKGFGTDEKTIIDVLANRSNAQRVYIAVAFKQLYGKDLIDDLKSELSGDFEKVVVGLMMPLSDYLASELHHAMSGIGTDEHTLIEILCTRTNQEIWQINEAYNRMYGKSLEHDIKSDTSGNFERLLISSCTGARSEAPANNVLAKEAAQALYEAGAAQWGTDESTFNSILTSESYQQLAHTFYEYQKLTGSSIVDAIKSEMSGDLKEGMLAIAKSVENRPYYFAEKLYKAMKGLGTDDKTLIRIVVSRCELDMVQIKAEYERNFEKPLVDAIKDDTSGDYKRMLVALVNGN